MSIGTHYNAIRSVSRLRVLKTCMNGLRPGQAFAATTGQNGKSTRSEFIHQIAGRRKFDEFAASLGL